jgi:hypothetical protein
MRRLLLIAFVALAAAAPTAAASTISYSGDDADNAFLAPEKGRAVRLSGLMASA